MVDELTAVIGELVQRHVVPGGAVVVVSGDRFAVACAGVTNLEQPLPVDPDTFFQIASITKTMTATAAARLVLDGEVDLDTRVVDVVPDFKLASQQHAAGVRVVDLLTHHGGFDGDEVFAVPIRGPLASVPGRCSSCRLLAPPGLALSYGNAGFAVVGALIERITGEPFVDALHRLALSPAGICAAFGAAEVITRRVAVAHLDTPDGPVVQRGLRWHGGWDPLPSEAPTGGAIVSITTLGRWLQATVGVGRHPLPSQLRELMFARWAPGGGFVEAMGLGWMHLTVDGHAAVYHRGDYPGYHSDVLCIPSLGFAVGGLSNGGPGGPRRLRDLRRHALARHTGLDQTDPSPDNSSTTQHAATSAVGTYDACLAILHVVRSTEGELRLHFEPRSSETGRFSPPAGPDVALAPLDANRLIISDAKSVAHHHPIDILRDRDGAITAIRWNLRICPRRPNHADTG